MIPAVVWLGEAACGDLALVGGKAANLSRLAAGHLVPPGFCLTTAAFKRALAGASRPGEVPDRLPPDLQAELAGAYRALAAQCGVDDPPVAVRSSAADEDGSAASFAGQHETFLNVRGVEHVADAVVRCWRSLWLPRALAYRREQGLAIEGAQLAVLVQQLIPADASGVLFSANPVSSSLQEAVLTASWGLGESIVGGTVTPDTYIVRKRPLTVLDRQIGSKRRMTVLTPEGTTEQAVPPQLQAQPVLDDPAALIAVSVAMEIEEEMGWPVDLELAWRAGALYLLQCRPITTLVTSVPGQFPLPVGEPGTREVGGG